MRISERLKLVCEQKNWKIKDFAELTGLPYRTMQGYIGGEREPNAEGMTAIAKVGVNLNWLVSGNGEIFTQEPIELAEQEKQLLLHFSVNNRFSVTKLFIIWILQWHNTSSFQAKPARFRLSR